MVNKLYGTSKHNSHMVSLGTEVRAGVVGCGTTLRLSLVHLPLTSTSFMRNGKPSVDIITGDTAESASKTPKVRKDNLYHTLDTPIVFPLNSRLHFSDKFSHRSPFLSFLLTGQYLWYSFNNCYHFQSL